MKKGSRGKWAIGMSERTERHVSLIGVSVPRSGHHFLAKLLEHALGNEIRYCEYYSEQDCCKQIPCIRGRERLVTYQKNHDLDLAIDPHLPGVVYVVQFREPVPAVVSDREVFAAVHGSRLAEDRAQYLMFLAEKAAHYTKFYDKWVRRRRPEVFRVKYERLREDPAAVIGELCRFCALSVSPNRIADAVANVAPVLARPPILPQSEGTAFTHRVPSHSRYFDPELLAVYESLVLEHVPELCAVRAFAPVDRVVYRDHVLFALFNLQCASLEGRLDEVARLARDAHTAWPDHPYVTFMTGDALRKLGHHDTALPYLEKAVRLTPHDPEIIVSCINAQIALGRLGPASELAMQLVALLPRDASHRLLLATILMMSGRAADALQQALHALDLGIGEAHLWRAFGRMVDQARQAGWTLRLVPTHERT